MFENDWMVAGLNNPNLDLADLTTIGELNTKNTQFLKKEDYLKSNFIKNNDAFKDENGNFSKQKFNDFYNYQASQWNKLLTGEFPKGLKLDPFDTAANRRNARVKDLQMNIGLTYNPERVQIGVEGTRTRSDRTKSIAELAQSQKIFNPETGKYEEYTPDDISLFSSPTQFIKNIFSDPLVLATYDEETVDELGNKHKKGDYKLNDKGTYYYERLNGRNAGNKLTLSFLDILTPENSALNKIDFFDSDDMKKSTVGTIAKNVAFMVPMFLGGPAASIYSTAIIAKELTKTLPMLYNVSTGLFGDKSSTPEWINTLAAKADLFSSGISEEGKANMWNVENFANLVTDVALQWGQQKQIAKTISKLLDDSSIKNAENLAFELYKRKATDPKFVSIAARTESEWKNSQLGLMALKQYVEPAVEAFRSKLQLGADVSLAYMSLISNTDVYQDMIDKGATKKEAAWVTLGSTLGMFSVDKYSHLGELFFDELSDRTALDVARNIGNKKSLKGEVADVIKEYGYQGIEEIKDKSPKALFRKGLELGRNLTNRFYDGLKNHNLGGLGKALGEGLEEVSEELVTDTAKGIYSLLGDLGLYDPSVKNAVDFDTMTERYAMSFLGGAVGGGLFYAKERFSGEYLKPAEKDLIELIRDGKADQIRNKVYELRDKGDLGSTTLSGVDYTLDGDAPTWLSTDKQNESQNDIIAKRILEKVDQIEATLATNGVNLTDDLLFDNMVLSELRYQLYKNASYITGYYHEFKKLTEQLVEAESQLKKARKTKDGTPTGELANDSDRDTPEKQNNLNQLLAKVDLIKLKITDHLSGDTSLDYTRKLMFALDPTLNDSFLDLNYYDWLAKNHPEKLDPSYEPDIEKEIKITLEWNEFTKQTMTLHLDEAWDLYKKIEQGISPELLNQQDSSLNYLQTLQILEEIRQNPDKYNWSAYFSKDENKPLTENDRLINPDGTTESDDDYNSRNDIYLDEDADEPIENKRIDNDKLAKKRLRQLKILQYNESKIQAFLQQYTNLLSNVNYKVDTATARAIRQNIAINIPIVMRNIYLLPKVNSDGSVAFDPVSYLNVMEDLKEDGSNVSDIKSRALEVWKTQTKQNIANALQTLDVIGFDENDTEHLINVTRRSIDFIKPNVLKTLKELNVNESLLNEYKILQKEGKNVLNATPFENVKLSDNQIQELELAGLGLTDEQNNQLNSDDDEDGGFVKLTKELLDLLKNSISTKLTNFFSETNALASEEEKKYLVELNTSQMKRSDFLRNILSSDNTGFFDITHSNAFGENYTLQQLLEELQNNTKGVGDKIALIAPEMMTLTEDGTPLLTKWLQEYQFHQGKDIKLHYFTQRNNVFDPDSQTHKLQKQAIDNYIDDVINLVLNHPLTLLLNNLKTEVKSPLQKIFETVAQEVSKDKNDLTNIEKLLNGIYSDFIDLELGSFELNGEQIKQLSNAKNVLKLVHGYIYSTSVLENAGHPFGHNQQINKFADEHSDKLQKPWDKLVELNPNYQGILFREISNLEDEITIWETISANNGINKAKRISQTDSATKKVKYNLLKELSAIFTIDDKNLFGTTLPDIVEPTMKDVAMAELKLFNGFALYLKDTGYTPLQFFEKTGFWEKLFNGKTDIELNTSTLHPELNEFTDFTKAVYLLTILSVNPTEQYKGIKNFLSGNSNIAPIPTLQELIRTGIAVMSPVFKEGMNAFADYTNVNTYRATSSYYINGVAGAGKTDVVLKAIRQYYRNKKALVIGPKKSQADKLATLLGETKSYTIEDNDTNIFKQLVKDYDKLNIDSKIAEAKAWWDANPDKRKSGHKIKNEYFTITFNDLYVNVELSDKIKFNSGFEQQLIFVDEAAHLNTIQLAILNKLAEKNQGVVYFASDSTLNGYKNGPIENLDKTTLFTTRSPKLQESLRSDNILKQDNDSKIQTLIDSASDLMLGDDESAWNTFKSQIPDLCKKMKLRSYIGEKGVTGDIFKANLDELIPQMNQNATVGYIGKDTDSTFIKLKNAGFNVSAFDKTSVQGQEFDYVVIGELGFNEITPNYDGILKLKDIYTLMTRGKKAALWIDDLKSIFGEPQEDQITSEGFSIIDLLDNFKLQFNSEFEQIDLSDTTTLPKNSGTSIDSDTSDDINDLTNSEDEDDSIDDSIDDEEENIFTDDQLNDLINNHQLDIPWQRKEFVAEGLPLNTVTGTSKIIELSERPLVLIELGGLKIPFYISTGLGGKEHVETGKWYPIFGIGSDGWFNKGSEEQINDYYGSEILREIALKLDEVIGDIRGTSIPKAGFTGLHIDLINSDLNPTENEMSDTLEKLNKNISEFLLKLEIAANRYKNNDPEGVEHSEVSNDSNLTDDDSNDIVELQNEKQKEQINQIFEENIETEVLAKEPEKISLNFGDYSIEANTVMPMTGFIKERRTINDSDTYVWKVPPTDSSGIKRNMNAFYRGDSGEIIDWEEKRQIQNMVACVQSAVLFGDSSFDVLDTSVRGFPGITKAWENREMLFEIRKAESYDNFGYGTDLKDTFIEIEGEKYVVSLVLKLPNLLIDSDSDEYDAYIDIALLNDPKTLAKHVADGSIKASLQNNSDPKVLHFVNNLEEISKQYSKFITDTVKSDKFKEKNKIEVVLNDEDWHSHKTTRLVKTKHKRRLGGLINPDAFSGHIYNRKGLKIKIEYEDGRLTDKSKKALQNHGSFMDIDPRNIVSDVYILTKTKKLKGVSENLIGKAVVFVTSDKNLDRNNLALEYFNLKSDPDNHTPRVRMVVLNNHGLSFSELCNHRISNYIAGGNSEVSRPWNMKTMGIRMFTAMWNFRASLQNMKSAYDKLLEEIAGSKEPQDLANARILIEKALEVESLRYRISSLQEEVKTDTLDKKAKRTLLAKLNLELLAITNINEDIVKRVLKFNEEDLIDVPTVRLGHVTTQSNRGFIRAFDVEKSSRYDLSNSKYKGRKSINMYSMNIDTMEHWLAYLNIILNLIAKNRSADIVYNNLGEALTDVTEAFGITVLDTNTNKTLDTNKYILKSDVDRNLSGIIKTEYISNGTNKSELVRFDDGFEYQLSADGKFGFIPKLLGDMLFKVRGKSKQLNKKYKNNPNARISDNINFLIKGSDGKDVQRLLEFNFNEFFELGFNSDEISEEMYDMFNVVLHGSTQNITGLDEEGISRGHAFTDDAPYKYGMFVDPEMTYGKPETLNIGGDSNKQEYTFLKCRIDPMLFDVNVKAIPGGAVVDMAKIIETVTGKKVDKTDKASEPIKSRYKVGDKINVFSDTGSFDLKAMEIIDIFLSKTGPKYRFKAKDGNTSISVYDVDNNPTKYRLDGDLNTSLVDASNKIAIAGFIQSLHGDLNRIQAHCEWISDHASNSDAKQYFEALRKIIANPNISIDDYLNQPPHKIWKIGLGELKLSDVFTNIEPERTYSVRFLELVNAGVIKNLTFIQGRILALCNINGTLLPFYVSSSGTSGKIKGKWYPFFGFGQGQLSRDPTDENWLIKGDISDMENGYGIPSIKKIQDLLNSEFNLSEITKDVGLAHNFVTELNQPTLTTNEFNTLFLGREYSGVQNGVNSQAFIESILDEFRDGPDNLSNLQAAQLLDLQLDNKILDLSTRPNNSQYVLLLTKLLNIKTKILQAIQNNTEINVNATQNAINLIMDEANSLDFEPDLSFVEPLFYQDFKYELNNGNVLPTEKSYKEYLKSFKTKFLQGLFTNGKYSQTEDEEGDAIDDPETDLKLFNYFVKLDANVHAKNFINIRVEGSGSDTKIIAQVDNSNNIIFTLSNENKLLYAGSSGIGQSNLDNVNEWELPIQNSDSFTYQDYKDKLAYIANKLEQDSNSIENITFIKQLLLDNLDQFKEAIEYCEQDILMDIIDNCPVDRILTEEIKSKLIDNLDSIKISC